MDGRTFHRYIDPVPHKVRVASLMVAKIWEYPFLAAGHCTLRQKVCAQPHPVAVNTALPAFDSERRAASPYFRSAVAGDGAVSELLLRCFNGTDRRTDIVPLHRSVRAVPVDFYVTCTGVPVPRCRPMMHVGRGICGTGLQVRVNVVCLPAPANQSHSTAARHSQPQ